MQHTYLRYECADSFGLVSSAASSKAPQSNSCLAFLGRTRDNPVVLTTAGSFCVGFHLRTSEPTIRIGHREQLSGGVGTGRAINSDQVVCVEVAQPIKGDDAAATTRVATGWVDGAVRVFDVRADEINNPNGGRGLVQSLLDGSKDEDFVMREPLLLNGHSDSAVRSLAFCPTFGNRLASGSNDGSVVLWDIVAETGLFRLLGHRGGITDIKFAMVDGELDYLITSSLDGLVKVWDLKGQCCSQTIPTHSGEVWSAACHVIPSRSMEESSRIRLLTGSNDGQVRVWSVDKPKRHQAIDASTQVEGDELMPTSKGESADVDNDAVCSYMGKLVAPANVATSADRISCIHYHPSGKFVGVLHANSKNIDVYFIRSVEESTRKKQRRLKRRKEKGKSGTEPKEAAATSAEGKKRGILDDPDSDNDEKENKETQIQGFEEGQDPEQIKASDEFEYYGTIRAGQKVKGFAFVPFKEVGGGVRIVCSTSTNGLELHSISRKNDSNNQAQTVSDKISDISMLGHSTGIRCVELSSDDDLACTVSKSTTKIWNVPMRTCIQSIAPTVNSEGCYGLCAKFLPGNSHLVVGTREGHLLLVDIAAGEVVYVEEKAHDGAVWSIDVRKPSAQQGTASVVTGSADKTVKFWDIEAQDDGETPMLTQTRMLQMTDDVVAVRYSHSFDASKRMVFISSLDSTIKVFFDDTLKFFLSLYGHKLPALTVDASDDDMLLASGGADKTIKIWGLDFGDTHRTLHGHGDSITDIRFVRGTHNFFSSSKDGTVRYWDGDRFEQILVLHGHVAEINSLAISKTGAFVLSGGMDRQVRVWERTKDMVFLEEERERELEDMFDKVDGRNNDSTAKIMRSKGEDDDDDDASHDNEPQSEAAVRRSVMSISAGDRILEGLERADQELKEASSFKRSNPGKDRMPNPLLLGKEPSAYVLWVLKSIKHAELEQSLLVLPLGHVERLLYYLVVLLRGGHDTEICSRVAVFLVKIHQKQLMTNSGVVAPLQELRRLVRLRLAESKDAVGFNLAALRMVARVAQERKEAFLDYDKAATTDIWAGLGIGSEVAAELQKGNRR